MKKTILTLSALLAACGGSSTPMTGTKIDDLQFSAFVDENGDGLSFNDPPKMVRLSDYFAANKPGTKIIMINAAAGWCGPCMHEAGAMSAFAQAYEPRGVAVLTAIVQTNSGSAADETFARDWAEAFSLSIPTLIDSTMSTAKYFDIKVMPANIFVDAATAEIKDVKTGAQTGSDPMKEYRDLLDFYLQ